MLQEIFISDMNSFSEDEIFTKIEDNLDTIQASDTIIINTPKFDVLLQILGKLHTTDNLNLNNKKIYLVTNSNKFFLKRMLAKYVRPIDITTIYTLSEDKLLNFLSTLSLGKMTTHEEYITPFSLSFQ
ncbi:MAG: hypothetical protein WCH65_00360 [bacterium]